MKILYLAAHALWPANTGARLRDFQLAQQLGARASVTFAEMAPANEQIQLRSVSTQLQQVIRLKKERTYTPWKILRGLAGPLPMTVLNCRSRSAARRLREILRDESFDTVQVEGVHLLEYLPAIL
jgi:hypothetical protein